MYSFSYELTMSKFNSNNYYENEIKKTERDHSDKMKVPTQPFTKGVSV